jgi:hypothetical protein
MFHLLSVSYYERVSKLVSQSIWNSFKKSPMRYVRPQTATNMSLIYVIVYRII